MNLTTGLITSGALSNNVAKVEDRANLAVSTGKNIVGTNLKSTAAIAAGVGATYAATNAVKNSSALQETITKGLKKVVGAVESSNVYKKLEENIAPYTRKAASWVKALPTPAKVVLATGAVLTGLIGNMIQNKGLFDQGKIVQQYEDKQAIRKTLNDMQA